MIFHLRESRDQLLSHFAGRIGRAVVENHQVEIVSQLGQHVEHLADVGFKSRLGIVDRQQHTERTSQEASSQRRVRMRREHPDHRTGSVSR